MCKETENIEEINFNENSQPNLTLTNPFIQKKRDIDRSILYSFKGPFKLLHADIADLRFLAKSAVDTKYCLLIVNLYLSYEKNNTFLKINNFIEIF